MALDHETTTEEVIAGIDLSGKTALVTGASAGLGIETARTLAGAGAQVVMLARDAGKLAAAIEGIRETLPDAELESQLMDLADLASVRAAGEAVRQTYPEIHMLINNAGVMACPLARTVDGFEMQFGTNHVGHFLFTCLVVPSLLAAAPARIVNLSSTGHRFGPVDFDDPNYREREYDKWTAYGQSKTANSLFSVALDKRLSGLGVNANAVHPGMIVTDLGRHLEQADIEMLQQRAADADSTTGFKSIPAGAATSVWAATSAELEGRGGLYLEDCHVAVPMAEGVPGGFEAWALDADAAEQLWTLSEQLVGQEFNFAG